MSIKFQSLVPNLMAADVNKTAAFYEKVLGFNVVMSVPEAGQWDWVMLKREDTTIMFQSRTSIEADLTSFGNQPIGGTLSFYIKVSNVRALFEYLKENVTIVKPLKVSFYGATEFVIQDLDGYYLMFSEYENN